MRPAGEIGLALLRAAEDLHHEINGRRRGPTLQELAERACVGIRSARHTVDNLKRARKLQIVAERRVAYRNRPVAEYAPAPRLAADDVVDVAGVFALWAQG